MQSLRRSQEEKAGSSGSKSADDLQSQADQLGRGDKDSHREGIEDYLRRQEEWGLFKIRIEDYDAEPEMFVKL